MSNGYSFIDSTIQRAGKGADEGERTNAHMHNVRDGSRSGMGECGRPAAAPRRAVRLLRPQADHI